MPSLVYIAEDSYGASYPLSKGPFTIGSKADLSLQLPSVEIATEHAVIFFEDGKYYLRDQGSDGGSFVNGDRIEQVPLKHNDILRFGEYRFRVNLIDPAEGANAQTSRIDLPPEAVRRGTRGLPTTAEVRRVIEMRPQALKSAETSQIEPTVQTRTNRPMGTPVEKAVVPRVSTAHRVSASTSASAASLVVEEKKWPSWVWFALGAVCGLLAAAAVAVMRFPW